MCSITRRNLLLSLLAIGAACWLGCQGTWAVETGDVFRASGYFGCHYYHPYDYGDVTNAVFELYRYPGDEPATHCGHWVWCYDDPKVIGASFLAYHTNCCGSGVVGWGFSLGDALLIDGDITGSDCAVTGEDPDDMFGWTWQTTNYCILYSDKPGKCQPKQTTINVPNVNHTTDPINTIDGCMEMDETDIALLCPGIPVAFDRSYRSRLSTNWSYEGASDALSSTSVVKTFTVTKFPGTNYWTVTNDALYVSAPAVLGSGLDAPRRIYAMETGTDVWESFKDLALQVTLTGGQYEFKKTGGITVVVGTNNYVQETRDLWGNKLTYTYTSGLVSRVQHSNGQYLDYAYTSGKLTSVTSPLTNFWISLSYSDAGRLTNVTRNISGASYATAYEWDGSNLTRRVNALGDTFDYTYSTGGIATSCVVNASYYRHTLALTGPGTTTVTYVRGSTNQVYRYYHSDNVITNIVGPAPSAGAAARTTKISHDAWGYATNIRTTAASGSPYTIETVKFDAAHNITNSGFGYSAAPTNFWKYEWYTNENLNLLTLATDPEGAKTAYAYTNTSVRTASLYYNSTSYWNTTFSYTTNGLLSCVTNANGHWAKFYYDQYGFPTSSVPQTGPTVNYQYSQLGHLTNISMPGDSGARTTSHDVNELGWVNSITYANGLSESFLYDAIGNVTNHTDTAGRETRYTYLPTRKLNSTFRPLTAGAILTNTISYDQQFNTLNLTDAKGREVECYQLDIEDRPVSVTNLEGLTMTIAYSIGDCVSQITRFDGTVVSNTYNGDGLLSSVAFPGTTNTFSYLKNGLLKKAANETATITNAWSYANRLTNIQVSGFSPQPLSVSYSHYPAGQVSNVISVAGTNVYSLDEADRLSSLSASLVSLVPLVFNFSYNTNSGLLSSMTCTNTGIFAEYRFDVMDRLTNLVWKNASSNVIRSFAYSYNNASMITNISLEDGSRLDYSYDELDGLVTETTLRASVTSVVQYSFDEVGNRTVKTNGNVVVSYSYPSTNNRLSGWTATGGGHMLVAGCSSEIIGTNPALGQLYITNSAGASAAIPSVSTTNFTSLALPVVEGSQSMIAAIGDEAGNVGYATNTVTVHVVTNAQYGYSAAGCVTSITYAGSGFTNTTVLTWDGQYQITEIATNGVSVERNGFDVLGRRVWNASTSSAGAWETNYFVYDGAQVIADLNGTGGVVRSYVWGPGIDNLLAMTVYTGATAVTYYPLTDHQGTIHALVDSSGSVVESYRFDAWGRVLGVFNSANQPITESSIGNRYLWQGREYSWQTGLYFFRLRWYDPITGRWLSNDPIGISGGLNQYVFCANNPVNFTDPFGQTKAIFRLAVFTGPTGDYVIKTRGGKVYSSRNDYTQLQRDLQTIAASGDVIGEMVVHGHGNHETISFAGGTIEFINMDNGSADIVFEGGASILADLRAATDSSSEIWLRGCNTGNRLFRQNIAEAMARALPGVKVTGYGFYGAGLYNFGVNRSVGPRSAYEYKSPCE